MAEEAKAAGLAVVVWSYPRGPMLDKTGETAFDICAYAAHMAALLGAHIIKVKPPTEPRVRSRRRRRPTTKIRSARSGRAHRAMSCSPASTAGAWWCSRAARRRTRGRARRGEVRATSGGGNGSIIGRNTFQRPRDEALAMLDAIIQIYQGKSPSVRPMRELAEAPAE